MSVAKDVKFSLKVMTNKEKTKVLFAEANGDFVDVLLSFLTMPVGKAVKVLEKHYGDEAPVVGSLTTLYKCLANLESVHFWTQGAKQLLLNPRSSFEIECVGLKLDIADTMPSECLACEECRMYITSTYCDSARCTWCGSSMKKQIVGKEIRAAASDGGVFVKNSALFIISDDLQILPDMTDVIQIFSILGITDTSGTELDNVTFGFSEIMDLFKASLLSPTPLSDVILARNRQMNLAKVKCKPGRSLPFQKEMDVTSSGKKVILKVIVQKSTNKLLYARAGEDFVDFLIGFLTIPLGGIASLLGKRTCFKSVDNLYKSVADLIDSKFFKTPELKKRLINIKLPKCSKKNIKLPNCSISRNQILPLTEGNYVKGPRMYRVADDLTITPFCISSIISTLKGLKITVSDIKEVELQIGIQEGLRILKASLTSTCVLPDALTINSVLKNQPKQEDPPPHDQFILLEYCARRTN